MIEAVRDNAELYWIVERKNSEKSETEKDHLDLFFDSIKATVRNFSPADIHTTKKQIFNYVSDIEDKYIWMRGRPNNDRGCADQPASNSTSRHTFNTIEQPQRYQQDSVHDFQSTSSFICIEQPQRHLQDSLHIAQSTSGRTFNSIERLQRHQQDSLHDFQSTSGPSFNRIEQPQREYQKLPLQTNTDGSVTTSTPLSSAASSYYEDFSCEEQI